MITIDNWKPSKVLRKRTLSPPHAKPGPFTLAGLFSCLMQTLSLRVCYPILLMPHEQEHDMPLRFDRYPMRAHSGPFARQGWPCGGASRSQPSPVCRCRALLLPRRDAPAQSAGALWRLSRHSSAPFAPEPIGPVRVCGSACSRPWFRMRTMNGP